MRKFLLSRCLPFIICFTVAPVLSLAQSADNNIPLDNAAIVKLVKAGFKEKSIITIIASRPARFELSTERMIDLKRSGVSEKVILAMLARQEGNEIDDSFGDDEFFSSSMPSAGTSPGNSTKDPQNPNARPANPNDGSSVDIFGNNGTSRGSVRSRGQNGSSSGDTITTGSATVRILRPPTEAGGAPAKLEKTPSLNNDAVIELVEAGFSDGTIIRRIEQSPVNFDLAPDKLTELKKHRVSEKIVTAMKAAMGDDSANTRSSNVTPKQ